MQEESVVYVGIMAEHTSVWDRRVPLTPSDIATLLSKKSNLKFVIQPSKKRIFKNSEYEEIGAEISEDLSKCKLILSVRAFPLELCLPNRTYMFFGHFCKAQPQNLPILDNLLEKKIRFIDYEKITDKDNKRLVYFGRIAGIAGTIDFLAGLGNLFLKKGISSPLLTVSYAYKYFSLQDAKKNMEKISKILQYNGMPKELSPLVFAITGRGRTSEGVVEILKLLPVKEINIEDLPALFEKKDDPEISQYIYLCYIEQQHMVVKNPTNELHTEHDHIHFNKHDYYKHPMKYKPIFHEKYLPYISVIFNCQYWDQRFPRLIEDEQMKNLCLEGKSRLLGVCDIACDLEGSIEFLKKYTNEDCHFYTYDAVKGEVLDDVHNIPNGILYLAIDAISRELCFDASTEFSKSLLPYIENIAFSDIEKPLEKQGLMQEIFEATVTWDGKLTSNYKFIETLRKTTFSSSKKKMKKTNSFVEIELIGHLFDTYAINDILDLLNLEQEISFNFYPYHIGRSNEEASKAQMLINGENNEKCDDVLAKIEDICVKKGVEMNLI